MAAASSFPWGLALALGGGAIALAIYLRGRRSAAQVATPSAYASPGAVGNGLTGAQTFGAGVGAAPSYGQPMAYGQPAGGGLGGRVMGGLATGLAVGAGVMAAQAIGKSLMGNDDEHPARHGDSLAGNGYEPLAANNDLGGRNFGVTDSGSWDDGGGIASSDGGGDWDT